MFRTVLNLLAALAMVRVASLPWPSSARPRRQPPRRRRAAPACRRGRRLFRRHRLAHASATPAAPVRGCARRAAAATTAKAARQSLRQRAPRIVAMVDVHVGRRRREGRDDRSRLRLAHDLDHLHRQNDRAVDRAAQSCARRCARSRMRARSPKRSSRSARRQGVLPSLLAACMREARLSAGISSDAGIKERAASSCAEIVRAEARRVRLGMGLLATIGATSPFVGLFGTVWGIMNSFIGISKAQTTNLAVVAPGIAEALLATAIGLVAAIPAVIIYNHFARVTKGYLELVNRASGAVGAAVVARSRPHPCQLAARARRRSRRWRLDRRQRIRRRGRFRRNPRDQRHAVHRRDAGAPDHLHGGGAAATVDLPIDLPTSSAMPQKKPDKPTYVSIKPDLTLAIGETRSSAPTWSPRWITRPS